MSAHVNQPLPTAVRTIGVAWFNATYPSDTARVNNVYFHMDSALKNNYPLPNPLPQLPSWVTNVGIAAMGASYPSDEDKVEAIYVAMTEKMWTGP